MYLKSQMHNILSFDKYFIDSFSKFIPPPIYYIYNYSENSDIYEANISVVVWQKDTY